MSLGGVFVIGLVAGTSSCLAVTGGLLLALAAKHNEVHQAETRWEKLRPLLHFNLGRLAAYFVLGGLVGVVGQAVTLSTRMSGYMSIAVALVMLYLALSILRVLPNGAFPIRPPKALSRWIHGLAESEHPVAPVALGAFTFFLPCGFTQSLQLVALASGSFLSGALTMFVFALGTLPALLGITILSSTARGATSRRFLRFSGVLVFVLALWNLQSGLRLTGVDAVGLLPRLAGTTTPAAAAGQDPNVTVDANGRQILYLHVTPYGYEPSTFTIRAGIETWVYARGEGARGCGTVLTDPAHNLTTRVKDGDNWLGPIRNPTASFLLTCSMGMLRSTVTVVGAS